MEAEIIRKVDDIVENSKSKHEKLKSVHGNNGRTRLFKVVAK